MKEVCFVVAEETNQKCFAGHIKKGGTVKVLAFPFKLPWLRWTRLLFLALAFFENHSWSNKKSAILKKIASYDWKWQLSFTTEIWIFRSFHSFHWWIKIGWHRHEKNEDEENKFKWFPWNNIYTASAERICLKGVLSVSCIVNMKNWNRKAVKYRWKVTLAPPIGIFIVPNAFSAHFRCLAC